MEDMFLALDRGGMNASGTVVSSRGYKDLGEYF